MAAQPVDFLWRQAPPLLWEARERLARFVQGDPRRIIFTVNVTAAVNLVAASLRLAAPGEILLTNMEYGAMQYVWERAAQRQALHLRVVPLPVLPHDPGEVVEAVVSAIRPETRLLFLSHILYTTGMVLPVREIAAAARRRGVLIMVDGAHAPGMIPLDLESLGCDFYGANLHKWLLAPIGAGFLGVGSGNEDRLQPLTVSWGWHYDRTRPDERDEFGGTPRLRSFEFEGTRDPCAWLTVPTAIEFHERLGAGRIRARHRDLSNYARERLGRLRGLELVTPDHPDLRGALSTFRLPEGNFAALRLGLWEEYRIELPIIEHAEGTFLRISTHFYNGEEELDRLAEALTSLLG